MTREFLTAIDVFGLTLHDLERITINSMKSAFIPYKERLKYIYEVIKPGYDNVRSQLHSLKKNSKKTMKKLFTNYNLDLDKNEKKLLTTFVKQSLKQTEADERFFPGSRAFRSVLEKLNNSEDQVKLTKDERTRLKYQMEQNVKAS
jgi:hypothetical protein